MRKSEINSAGDTTATLSGPASLIILLIVLAFSFKAVSAPAEEMADITASRLEYFARDNTYIAKGSVKIKFRDSTLSADMVRLDSDTSDAAAAGNVVYEDGEAVITADRMELNLKTKLGTIYNGYIFYKNQNFHLHAGNIKKIGRKTFFLDRAAVTTCDAETPAWHISGKDITIRQNRSLTAWNTTFNIKNIPVIYTPFFWAPLNRQRETGLLFPSFGYSSAFGNYYKQGFFWAVKDSQDATFYLDYYGEKGLGKGLDYRYIISPETGGEIWAYYIRDKTDSRELVEFKSYHNQKFPHNISGYLKLHLINRFDYYETMGSTSSGRFGLSSWKTNMFGFASEERLQKYLESDLHISKPFFRGRTYLLAQGRQSLEGSSSGIPQNVPEAGIVLNTASRGNFSFNMAVRGNNFHRQKGREGVRLDINPNMYFSYGRLINITQRVGLRETAYFLRKPTGNKNRLLFDLSTALTTKFFRKYPGFIHIVEPSVEYEYVPAVDNDGIPFFDSIDSISQTSRINYSVNNRITGLSSNSLEAGLRLSQSYNMLDIHKEFTPLLAEAALSSNRLDLSINASYDVRDRRFSDSIASVRLKGKKGYIGTGKNFRRSTSLDQVSFEAGLYRPIGIYGKSLPVGVSGRLMYDLNGRGLQEMNLNAAYVHQCWGMTVSYIVKPDEYQVIFSVGLAGLGNIRLGGMGDNPFLLTPDNR